MSDEAKTWTLIVVAIIVIAVIAGAATFIISSWSCRVKARALDVPCTWGPVQGCIITTPGGTKIPIEQYRVID